jgi:hypothetical protein
VAHDDEALNRADRSRCGCFDARHADPKIQAKASHRMEQVHN